MEPSTGDSRPMQGGAPTHDRTSASPPALLIRQAFPSARPMGGELATYHLTATQAQWSMAAAAISSDAGNRPESPSRLIALWGASDADGRPLASAVYGLADGLLWVDLPLDPQSRQYPDLSRAFFFAGRMQRAIFDLGGLRAIGADDVRPWLVHARDADARSPATDYPFVRVSGAGVHEIAVGPVHAGIIEPGHFRFSVSGEKVLRLEARLGYKHKGIDARYTQLDPILAGRLAGRVSGDSTVAHAWAYCMALESAAGIELPPRAAWLRALMLERERVANHLGDLGALANDAGLAFGLAHFSRLRELWLRESDALYAHRLMMDQVIPGGVLVDLDASMVPRIGQACRSMAEEVQRLRAIYDEHPGLQDRFRGTGTISTALARQLGMTGLAGRASGLGRDLRHDHPGQPWSALSVHLCLSSQGDVAARVAIRFDELLESLRLIEAIASRLPPGTHHRALRLPQGHHCGAGAVEGWRGEVLVGLEIEVKGDRSRIVRCHSHDPSWQNWPALEHAIIGNIVPDFPLINKSFNLSYAGHDL